MLDIVEPITFPIARDERLNPGATPDDYSVVNKLVGTELQHE